MVRMQTRPVGTDTCLQIRIVVSPGRHLPRSDGPCGTDAACSQSRQTVPSVNTWGLAGPVNLPIATLSRVEHLRASTLALQDEATPRRADLLAAAEGDGAAVQAAWAGFVPYLAHPVMADAARAAMVMLEEATSDLGARYSAAM